MADDVNDSKKNAILKDLLVAADKRQLQGQSSAIQISEDNLHKIDYPEFWKDLMLGAKEISTFVWGTPDKARSVFHLAETSNLPIGRLGSKLAAQKSVIRAFFWARAVRDHAFRDQEELVQLGVMLAKLLTLVRAANRNGTVDPSSLHLWMAVLTETSRAIDRILKSE